MRAITSTAAASAPPEKPVPITCTVPSSVVCGARASSAVGFTWFSVMSSVARAGAHRPLPLSLPPGNTAEPRATSSDCTSSTAGSSGRARTSASMRRTGSKPSSMRPARAFASSILTWAGWSKPLDAITARPLSEVAGAALANAERSSAFVVACRLPSGHAANGRTTAPRSADCAPCVALASTRTVAATSSLASGPLTASPASNAGTDSAARTPMRAVTANGESAAICAEPFAPTLS